MVLHRQPPLSDAVWDYLQDLPALSMVLTYDCCELILGWEKSRKLEMWSSRTNQELADYLLPYKLAKKDNSWASLLCAAYRSGESYFIKQVDAGFCEKIIPLPILQLALGPNDGKKSKEFASFQRMAVRQSQKRRVADTAAIEQQKMTKRSGANQTKGQKDISEVLDSFFR